MARSHSELDHSNRLNRRLGAMAIAMAAWVLAGTATAAETDAKNWDQSIVTGIAKSLAESVVGVEDALRNDPGNMMPTGDRRARYAVKQDLRRLRREAKHLAKELESGLGMEETLNVFLKLQEIAHYAALNGRRAMLGQTTLDHVATAREHLTKLAPYYGETWTPLMNTR